MTLDEIKHIAVTFPEQIEINWDKIDEDPTYRQEFEQVVSTALKTLPMLEDIHRRLSTGTHAVFDTQFTTINPAGVAEYLDAVEEELFAAYQMGVMWDAYQKVQNVINA